MTMVLKVMLVLTLYICFVNAKYLVSPAPGSPSLTTTQRVYTCVCEDNAEPLCANNGVTYKNKCRFECAKHKVTRLRVVKEGECGKNVSKLQFWSFSG